MRPLDFVSSALLVLAGAACQDKASGAHLEAPVTTGSPAGAPAVPAALKVPEGQKPVLRAQAKGAQVYTCSAKEGGAFAWTLKGPDAELFDAQAKPIGKHYAGPTWESADGSKVVGQVKEKADAPDPGAIQWLLLEAKSNAGQGVFGKVKSVQRIETRGGKAPAAGCDAAHAGAETRVDYQAAYVFYDGAG